VLSPSYFTAARQTAPTWSKEVARRAAVNRM
jgi:hypothetical protein